MTASIPPVHPVRLEPIPVARVWGGTQLFDSFHSRDGGASQRNTNNPERSSPDESIGESWALSDYGGDTALHSVIAGSTPQRTLRNWVARDPQQTIGRASADRLPLLFKFLDAAQDLSVQLHPSDADVAAHHLDGAGKSEAWIVIEAEPGARVVYGLEEAMTRDRYLDACARGEGDNGLHWIPVKRGDIFDVPPGTIHAIGGGILLAEIQQTSDTTYRLFDWNRVGLDGTPRTLHLDDARKVSSPTAEPVAPLVEPAFDPNAFVDRIDGSGRPFRLAELRSDAVASAVVAPRFGSFGILAILDGSAQLEVRGESQPVARGDVFFWPSAAPDGTLTSGVPIWALWMEPSSQAGW